MANPKLPNELRDKIIRFFRQGYNFDEVYQKVREEALYHLKNDEEIRGCLRSIKGKAKDKPKIKRAVPPKIKKFDKKEFEDDIEKLKGKSGKDLEKAVVPIVKDILIKYEKFEEEPEPGPPYRGTPFDLFGFKNNIPYAIEVKTSLESFNYPGETQKVRLKTLKKKIKGLHVALFQIAVTDGRYKIFYDEQMDILFNGPKTSLDRIEDWIKKRLR